MRAVAAVAAVTATSLPLNAFSLTDRPKAHALHIQPATHRLAASALGVCAKNMHCAMPVSAPPHTIDSSRVDCRKV